MPADQLATPQDLASLLQLGTYSALTANQQATLTMLVELATAKVQAAAGQRILDVTDTAIIDVTGDDWDEWLQLPQLPVRSVATVLLDGVADTGWVLRRQMLWRLYGWNIHWFQPTQVTVTFTHGYLAGSQALQLARDATLAVARGGFRNPSGITSEAIDDYKVTFVEADARMQVPPSLKATLVAAYGAGAYVTLSR